MRAFVNLGGTLRLVTARPGFARQVIAVRAVAVLACGLGLLPVREAMAQQPAPPAPPPIRNDSMLMPVDPSRAPFGDTLRPVRRQPVTAALDASAYATPEARALIQRARVARLRVDSTLRAYQATSYRRATVGIGIRALGAERVLYRQESSGEVRWERGVGAQVTVTGQREAAPIAPGSIRSTNPVAFPYFPGKDALWVGGATIAREEVDETRLVHPIALGAEAYYR